MTQRTPAGGPWRSFVLSAAVLTTLSFAVTGVVAASGTASAAGSSSRLDLPGTLARKGVRAVAVVFYASHCVPCKAEAPRWEELRREFGDLGLRVIAVNTHEEAGRHEAPPFAADNTVWDAYHAIADAWGVSELPAAFVFSWRGRWVAGPATAEDVAPVLRDLMGNSWVLRVDTDGVPPAHRGTVDRLVRQELRRRGKLTTQDVGPITRRKVERMVKAARTAARKAGGSSRDAPSCPDLTATALPNALLECELADDRLTLRLVDAQGRCPSVGSASCDAQGRGLGACVGIAVERLHSELVRGIALPGYATRTIAAPSPPPPSRSRPSPPTSRRPSPPPALDMTPRIDAADVAPEVGALWVGGSPKDTFLEVHGPDGRRRTATSLPATLTGLPPGEYTVKATARDHVPSQAAATVRVDDMTKLSIHLERPGALKVTGTPAKSRVVVEDSSGAEVGSGGLPIRRLAPLLPGDYTVRVTRKGYEPWQSEVHVEAGKTAQVKVELTRTARRDRAGGGGGGGPKGKLGIEWIRLPAGRFEMGGRTVRVPTFELAKTEVTVAQYKACVDAGRCSAPDTGKFCNWGKADRRAHPVNCVDWKQAQAFATWAGARLPSEAEWEYAARSGGRSIAYPWGDEAPTCDRAILGHPRKCTEADPCGCGRNGTWPVCSKPRGNSAQGVCDLAGNVWEWVQDCYGEYEAAPKDGSAASGCSAGANRVLRGGGWNSSAAWLRAANRSGSHPTNRWNNLGFRLSRSVP